jgi:hypothetical protein
MKVFKNPEPKGLLILNFFENQNRGSLIMIFLKKNLEPTIIYNKTRTTQDCVGLKSCY